MMQQLTEVQRRTLLDRAVEAVRAVCDIGPGSDPADVRRRREVARLAVTDAVTRASYLHTAISAEVGLSGLQIVDLIDDWTARGNALAHERNAATSYTDLVRRAAAAYAQERIGVEGPRARSVIARLVGVTPVTVDAWVAEGGER